MDLKLKRKKQNRSPGLLLLLVQDLDQSQDLLLVIEEGGGLVPTLLLATIGVVGPDHQSGPIIIQAMKGIEGPIETSENTVKEAEDRIQIDTLIGIHLLQEGIGVGAWALIQGNHIELDLFLQNITEKVHLIEEGKNHVLILDPQVITEVVSHLPRLMKSNKRAKDV